MIGDGPVWCCDLPVELRCGVRAAKMDLGGNNMAFQERFLDANGGEERPELCDNLVYAVMLRKPIDRVISHLNELSSYLHFESARPGNSFVLRLGEAIKAGCTDATSVAEALFLDESAAAYKETMSSRPEYGQNICGITSNYMTRSMLGSTVFGEDVYKTHFNDTLAEDSVEAAITVLQSMSVVLVLEMTT